MKNRKVWIILSSLSEDEQRRFPLWLAVELGAKQQYLQALCKLLIQALPVPPERAGLWQSLYPETRFDDARLRKLTRDLTRWLEEFIAIERFRQEKDQRELYLLRGYQERQLDEVFVKEIRKVDKALMKREIHDREFYHFLYELEIVCQSYEAKNRSSIDRKLPTISALDPAPENIIPRIQFYFDRWWVQEKLFISTSVLSQKQVNTIDSESLLLNELLEYLEKDSPIAQNAIVQLYQKVYLLLTGGETESIEQLIQLLGDQYPILPKQDLQTLWLQLVNYYVRSWNETGNNHFGYPLTHLFEWAIEADFLLVDRFLPEVYYRNLITITLRIQQYEKAWTYIHSYRSKLNPTIAEASFTLGVSSYYTYKKEFQKVVDLLRHKRFFRPLDEIRARSYLLNAYFEIGKQEEEWLVGQTNNLIRYIRRKSFLPENHKRSFINRFQLFKKVLQAYQPAELQKISESVKVTIPLDDPNWLLQKIEKRMAAVSYPPSLGEDV